MENPLSTAYTEKQIDENLIDNSLAGDRRSLEELIRRHQDWIYNIALRMVFNREEAKDITQEVLIKIITNLSSFRKEAGFRTWAYRIAVNHILNVKKTIGERMHSSNFADYGTAIDRTPDHLYADSEANSPEMRILVEEVKLSCLTGMLLCLDREQRMVYILGSMLGVNDAVGSDLLGISRDNFRQKLSRARKDLYNFMHNKCGLVDRNNPCRCLKKTKALVDSGYVNAKSLRFNRDYVYKIENVVEQKLYGVSDYFDEKCDKLFRDQPFQKSPDFIEQLRGILDDNAFRELFNLN